MTRLITTEIQCIESIIAVFFPVHNIGWGYPKFSVQYEEGDKYETGFRLESLTMSGPQKPEPINVTEKEFVRAASLAFGAKSLIVLGSFWREGENELFARKFINAFYNYYFIIEGLYGRGKSYHKNVTSEFFHSTELKDFVKAYLADPHDHRHMKQVADMLPPTALPPNVTSPRIEDFIELLVSTRGQTHHFSHTSTKPQASPLVHQDYEGIAMFARYLAQKAVVAAMSKTKPVLFREVPRPS